MATHYMSVGNQAIVGLHNDYARLPRSSGDGMESQRLATDKNLMPTPNYQTTETVHKIALVNPQISSTSSGKEVHRASFKEDLRMGNENLHHLPEAKHRTLSINKSKETGKTSEQHTSLECGNINENHVGFGVEVAGGTSLSVERNAECLDLQSLVKNLETRNQKISKENEKLLNKLSVQSKVNADLKKLLVASVGEDIGMRLEEMTADKAQFDTTLKNLERNIEETSEELGKVSIECDVWRTKFLASRMMTNGLTDIKTSLFLKHRNSQAALQKLLEEQSDIRQHLRATNRLLKGIHETTNCTTHQSTKENSWHDFQKSSIVELSHINFSLAEDICHAVNPSHFYSTVDTISSADEEFIPVSDLTPAEQMACQALKSDSGDADELGLAMNKIGRQYIGNSYASRFLTNNFRITFDCCERCTGALKVV